MKSTWLLLQTWYSYGNSEPFSFLKIMLYWEFSGCLVVRTPCFHCRGHVFNPWLWNLRSHWRSWHSQIKKKQCCAEFHVFNPFFIGKWWAIPTSGLSGENLITRSQSSELTGWYKGLLCLLEQIGKTTTILILIHYKLDNNYYLEFL